MDERVMKEGDAFMRKNHKDAKCETLDGSTTLLHILQNLALSRPNNPFLGTIVNGKVVYQTYAEVLQAATRLACFLEGLTVNSEIIGIYSVNRAEWIIAEYASYLSHCSTCPIFSAFSPDSLAHILQETELTVLVASASKASSLLNIVLTKEKHSIKHLILMDDDKSLVPKFSKIGINVHFLSNIISEDRGIPQRVEPMPEDVATICYTSGTSGVPKGVILKHRNFLSVVSGFMRNKDPKDILIFTSNDTYISYLPLPHVLERICFTLAFSHGVKIAFYRGDPSGLQNDCKIIKPTFIVVVPRVLNMFKEKIEAAVAKANLFKRLFFRFGIWFKTWRQRHGVYTNWFFDKLVFSKVFNEFGGEIRYSLCGGASLNPKVLRFIQAAMSMRVFQGYGQTEGLAADILLPLDINDDDSVGIPFPGIQVKLDMKLDYGENCGELLMRGGHITTGYFKRPNETAQAFTADGWLRTGDIACERNGRFYIMGRVKEMFKTSYGEYIVPEVVENHFSGGIIEDMFITGSKYSDYLLAVVVCQNPSINQANIMSEIKKRAAALLSARKIKKCEVPAQVVLVRDPFSTYNDGSLITPSLKKRRKQIYECFKSEIENGFKAIES